MAEASGVHVEWRPAAQAEVALKSFDMSNAHSPPIVGDIVGQRSTVVCLASASLSDAVDLLVMHDRTAAGIVGDEGELLGVLTENDLVLAYAGGFPGDTLVSKWLSGGRARLPAAGLPELTLHPSATLLQAAQRMRAHVGSPSACHHVVVSEQDGGFSGILSSLDLARALCSLDPESDALGKLRRTPVLQVMKRRADLPSCSRGASLGEALAKMDDVHQNCLLVTGGAAGGTQALGIVTPRDALRAYGEHVPLCNDLGRWLRALRTCWQPRKVSAAATLADVATAMAEHCVHHLVVTCPATQEVLGVVSSSDLVGALEAERHGALGGG